ncbi:mechanosensitive ion channel family protein [Microbacterium sp. NPDC019599]|uniref:mechanosensitive ion channel family protein n=1 Tax=Microbacterium sp. NPDC019599 TaxID=3154690 RepID=UPI0033D5EB5C
MDLSALLPTSVEWWQVLLAIVLVIAGWILSRLARKGTLALLRKAPTVSELVAVFIARFVAYSVVLLAVALALAVLGVNMQPLLALAVVLAVVAVLVLRGVADNFAAGVVIQASKPVELGDEIMVEGPDGTPIVGVVRDLNSRTVVLETYDGRTVHVPNAKMVQDTIVNHSSRGLRRSEVQVRTSYLGADTADLLDRLAAAAASVPGVDGAEPARAVAVTISPERLTARILFWHAPADGLAATSGVVAAASAVLQETGVEGTATSNPGLPPLVPPDSV